MKSYQVEKLKIITNVAVPVTVTSKVGLAKLSAPSVKSGVLWGDGASQSTVCRLTSKPENHVFEVPRKISHPRTPTNLADTAYRFRLTPLSVIN